MSEEQDEGLDRTEKRRRQRAAIGDRRQVIEQFAKLPDDEIQGIEVSPDVLDSLVLIRRLRPSGARARLVKNLSRRTDDDDWANIVAVVEGRAVDGEAMVAHDEFVVGLRDDLVAGHGDALQVIRTDHPRADHQRLRQFVLQARRHPESGPAKGARKKLLKALRGLYPRPGTVD